jgi:formate dehydrogenase subunit delta
MEIGNLIRMANRIGDFFDAMPDRPEAIEGVANHIQKSWEPRMRVELLAFLDRHPDGADGDIRLSPIVLEAVSRNRARLAPRAAIH